MTELRGSMEGLEQETEGGLANLLNIIQHICVRAGDKSIILISYQVHFVMVITGKLKNFHFLE